MYTAKIATAKLKAAWQALMKLTVPVAVSGDMGTYEVQVLGTRALEQVPGETACKSFDRNTVELSRTYDGVKFYTLMTKQQYEALQR